MSEVTASATTANSYMRGFPSGHGTIELLVPEEGVKKASRPICTIDALES